MADINEIYNLVKYRANKSGFLGNVSPNDFNLLFPRAEIKYFNSLYAQYYKSQRISDALSRFFTDKLPVTLSTNGIYDIPEDLLHVDALTIEKDGIERQIKRVEKDRIGNNLSSVIEPPTAKYPIYTEYSDTLQFYPKDITGVKIVYLRKPTTSLWAYTLVGQRPVYDEANSVQPEWSSIDIDNIIYLLLQDVSMNMRDGMLQQFSQVETQQAK